MLRFRSILTFVFLLSLLGCNDSQNEKMVKNNQKPSDVYKKMLNELKEPEGMLEKEKFFAKKAFLEEQSGLIDDAIQSLKDAISLNPTVGLYHFRLAKLYLKKGDLDNAHLSAKKAIDLGNNDEELLLFTAGLYLEDKNYREGLYFLEDRFGALPESSQLLYIRGRLRLGSGDSIKASEDLEKALEKGNSDALRFMAELSFADNPNKVISLVNKMDGQDDEMLWLKAQSYVKMGYPDSSAKCLESMDTLSTEQTLYYARLLKQMGNKNLAIDQYNLILKVDSTNQEARDELSDLERNVAYLQPKIKKSKDSVQSNSGEVVKPDSLNLHE